MPDTGIKDLDEAADGIRAVLESVRVHLQEDGGDIELVRVDPDGNFHVRFLGACRTCSLNIMTLQAGIMKLVNQRVPGTGRAEMIRD